MSHPFPAQVFVLDIAVSLRTAYFDGDAGAWVTDQGRIARRYAGSWLLVDVLSVVPYEFIPLHPSAGIVKMIKLVRLLKLLRAARQPRIMSKLAVYITMSAAQQIVVKFFTGLLMLVHLSACALRIVAHVVAHGCHVGHDPEASGCPQTSLRPYERQPISRQYVYTLTWALQTLLGDLSFTHNVAEEVLALLVALGAGKKGCETSKGSSLGRAFHSSDFWKRAIISLRFLSPWNASKRRRSTLFPPRSRSSAASSSRSWSATCATP